MKHLKKAVYYLKTNEWPFAPLEKDGHQLEGSSNVTAATPVLPGAETAKGGHSQGSMDTRAPLHKKLIQKDQNRKTQSYKVESVSGGANMDMHNFSLENKRETEYVSFTRWGNESVQAVMLSLYEGKMGYAEALRWLAQYIQ